MAFARKTALECGLTEGQIHLEHFGAEIDSTGDSFDVILARSDRTIPVSPDETILQALDREGITVPSACQNGVCGRCLTGVVSGRPDHRDTVLTDAERARGGRIAVCCSR